MNSFPKIIWQYWETKGEKPYFVDGLHEIAKKNSGAEVVLVTPESLRNYLDRIPDEIFQIEELAHKADMIRTLLVYQHGGMWLDSDAIVLSNLDRLFELLATYDFIGFNEIDKEEPNKLNVKINCFLARPRSKIMKQWVEAQHAKFPKTKFNWTEIGTSLLDPIVLANINEVKLLPFEIICPIQWYEVDKFSSKWIDARKILDKAQIVMLSNKALERKNSRLTKMTLDELADDRTLISDIIRRALDSNYQPPSLKEKAIGNIISVFKPRR
jgi:hypothetical protein